jgi:hypothetical protein
MKSKSTMGDGAGYTNKNGNDVYPYAIVSATPSELALYKKITPKGVYKETPEGHPIYFSSVSLGDTATLQFNFAKTGLYCVERRQRKAKISQMRADGLKVDKAAEEVLAQMYSGKVSTSESDDSETDTESATPEVAKPKVKVVAKRKATAKGISQM